MGGSLHLCVGHSVDIYSVDILTGSGIIVTEPRKLRHCPHCYLASQPPNLLTPSHFVTASLQLYFVQNLSDIFFESFIGFEVKNPKPFFSPEQHEIQTFTGDIVLPNGTGPGVVPFNFHFPGSPGNGTDSARLGDIKC